MANVLRDLIVDRVSFVDRAAVRDPENPTEPQRYLFWKSEAGHSVPAPPKEEPTVMTATAEAEAKAAEIRKSERGLTRDQALAMVYEEDPLLLIKAVNEPSDLVSTGRYLVPDWTAVSKAAEQQHGAPGGWVDVVKSEAVVELMNAAGSADAAEFWTNVIANVRKAEKGLTVEQAVAMVLEEAPQLAESYNTAFSPVIPVAKADTSPAARGRAELAAGAVAWAEELEDRALSQRLLAGPLSELLSAYEAATKGGLPPRH
jgi:hypothetical protein